MTWALPRAGALSGRGMPSVELLSRQTGHFTLDANSQPQIDQLWVR